MALPYFVTLTGQVQGEIKGFSNMEGHEGQIQCHAFEQTIDRPINKQDGTPVGLRVHHPLKITKSFDPASPALYQALVTGERLTEVKLAFYRMHPDGYPEEYFTITMTDALIVSIKPVMYNLFDNDLDRYDHLEEISFTYGQINWLWVPDGIEAMDNATPTRS